MALLGRTAKGWQEWKTKFGSTLDEVKRQTAEPGDAEIQTDSERGST